MSGKITASCVSFGGGLRYTWPLTLVQREGTLLICRGEAGREVRHHRRGRLQVPDPSLELYWLDRDYTICANHDRPGRIDFWYCNICEPPLRFDGAELTITDLELDVVMRPGQEPELVDEAEFRRAVEDGVIPLDVAERAREAAGRVLESARVGDWPFHLITVDALLAELPSGPGLGTPRAVSGGSGSVPEEPERPDSERR